MHYQIAPIEAVTEHFLLLYKPIYWIGCVYLDYNATTPIFPEVSAGKIFTTERDFQRQVNLKYCHLSHI